MTPAAPCCCWPCLPWASGLRGQQKNVSPHIIHVTPPFFVFFSLYLVFGRCGHPAPSLGRTPIAQTMRTFYFTSQREGQQEEDEVVAQTAAAFDERVIESIAIYAQKEVALPF